MTAAVRPCHLAFRASLATLCLAVGILSASARADSFVPDFSGVDLDPYVVSDAVPNNPIVTRFTVPSPTYFVADPFLYKSGSTWYIFFEQWDNYAAHGNIGYVSSDDGYHYAFGAICLRETFHLSFPYVFQYDGIHYMLQVGPENGDIRLYRAEPFPDVWVLDSVLMLGTGLADPAIFRYQNRWYMFVCTNSNRRCDLYSSSNLKTGWTLHPSSPIVANNAGKARPAGRTFVYGNGKLTRYAQKCDVVYGEAVRAFQIDLLTPNAYAEHEVPESPLIQATHEGWNSEAMHSFSPWWDGTRWLVAVDGEAVGGRWTIGLYRTSSPAEVAAAPRPHLVVEPNPMQGEARFLFDRAASRARTIVLYDVAGREERRLDATAPILRWDGRDGWGQLVPNGVYFARLDAAQSDPVRLVVTR
ncbi:MAG: hypothetical protein U0527_10755 [Candidatus Eisenbacteria bacterium]